MGNTTLNVCLRLLSERAGTHPHLTSIWTNYLTQRTPSEQDLNDCCLAVRNMDTISDIDPAQLPAICGTLSFLSSHQDDALS
jgi:hypothetical protein